MPEHETPLDMPETLCYARNSVDELQRRNMAWHGM